jgi:hypothetical protein
MFDGGVDGIGGNDKGLPIAAPVVFLRAQSAENRGKQGGVGRQTRVLSGLCCWRAALESLLRMLRQLLLQAVTFAN